MSYNILIVDDSAIIRSVVKKTLAMTGLEIGKIHEAENGQKALDIIHKEWVDIILADIHMPTMNGIEMVRKLNEENITANVPIVIISSDRSEKHITELQSLGVRAYLNKPFTPEEFRDTINSMLRFIPATGSR